MWELGSQMAASSRCSQINCSNIKRLSFFHHLKHKLSSSSKHVSRQLFDSVADSVFQFVDQPLLSTQKNFAPVEELKHAIILADDKIQGHIPDDFPTGVYARIGPNPLFGGLKSTSSVVGKTGNIWIEGEGMIHALYFYNNKDTARSCCVYKNRYVESETMKLEKQRNKPLFIPAIEGHSPAILLAILLNLLRLGRPYKLLSNTNIFEHGGKFYAIADNHTPQEIDILTLETLGNWDVHGAWNATTFTSHPKRAPDGSGELVVIGMNPFKPFMEVGVISDDGTLIHKANPNLKRCTLAHDFGVTTRLVSYNHKEYARIGVMPRYGDSNSIEWFDVDSSSTLHILNCFEDADDEVVVWGCRSLESVLSSDQSMKLEECEWIAGRLQPASSMDEKSRDHESLVTRGYEWRLNMKTGTVSERYLTGTEFAMEFPTVNPYYSGVKNRYAYTQVLDSVASAISGGLPKFGSLAKLHFEEKDNDDGFVRIKVHKFEDNTFCSGVTFVPKQGNESGDEDDGWLLTFTHNEDTDTSMLYILDAKTMEEDPVAKVRLPYRVPYGFHGAFFPITMEDIHEAEDHDN
ncbi:Carotenoid 9,10(9',10')-cleavage dioxygenase 1 [Linum grandiflorum]